MNKEENCIYLISNDFNDQVYVGVATNLQRRMYEHSIGKDSKYSPIDQSIQKHGWEHFSYQVLDHYSTIEERKEKEIYYIAKYDSYHHGYNATKGGDFFPILDVKGENNPRAQLTEEDVKNIRIRRMNGERLSVVYEDYKDRLNGNKRAGFSKLWLHESWVDVCPEFKGHYPAVNPKYYATITKNELTEQDIEKLTLFYKWHYTDIKMNIIYKQGFQNKIDWESFQKISKQILEKLYGKTNTRYYYKKTGKLEQIRQKYKQELNNQEPSLHDTCIDYLPEGE